MRIINSFGDITFGNSPTGNEERTPTEACIEISFKNLNGEQQNSIDKVQKQISSREVLSNEYDVKFSPMYEKEIDFL